MRYAEYPFADEDDYEYQQRLADGTLEETEDPWAGFIIFDPAEERY